MLRFSDIVFGPIHSRRLGSSLGVNLLPPDGKLCNFDCVYCECGWNRDGITGTVMPVASQVKDALESKLAECRKNGIAIDSITFSGNGEPTLNPDFPDIMDITVELRDSFCPGAKVSVFSNATTLENPMIVRALKKADNPILKLDSSDISYIRALNRPQKPYSIEKVISGMLDFHGNFILQTMFVKYGGLDFSDMDNLSAWMDIVRKLRPREIMVYTIDRETPDKGLKKFSADEMSAMVKPLTDEGFFIQIRG